MVKLRASCVALLLAFVSPQLKAQTAGPAFTCKFVMIPMRDGVRLNTNLRPERSARFAPVSAHAHALWHRRRHGGR